MRLDIDKVRCGIGKRKALFWDLQLPPNWNPWVSIDLMRSKELLYLLRICYNLDKFTPVEPYNATVRTKVRN